MLLFALLWFVAVLAVVVVFVAAAVALSLLLVHLQLVVLVVVVAGRYVVHWRSYVVVWVTHVGEGRRRGDSRGCERGEEP